MAKKIAFIDSYSDLSGGAPKSMMVLTKLLLGKNVNVNVLTAADGALAAACSNNNIVCKLLNTPKYLLISRTKRKVSFFSFFSLLANILFSWIKSYKLMTGCQSDVYCVNDTRCFLFYLPFLLLNRKKVVWYVRIKDRISVITPLAGLISRRIILVSDSCVDIFNGFEKRFLLDKISTVHTGFKVDKSIDSKLKENNKEIVVASVGVLSERKNIQLLINSLCKVSSKLPIKCIIAGDSKNGDKVYKKYLNSLVEEKGLKDTVEFLGHRSDVENIYSQSDILSLTSKAEGLPRVAIEALSYGCFVCSTPVDGINEIVTSSDFGVISDNYTTTAYSDALNRTLLKISEIKKSRKVRKKHVEKNFSEESFVENFLSAVNF